MKWFEGSVNEAVTTAKSRNAIFVVFVEGKDNTSVQVAQAISSEEVSSRLEQEDFVSIKLESDSDAYKFFVQIYQLVPVPSLFFIGENGVPLEVIAGNATVAELTSKIDSILPKIKLSVKTSSINLTQSKLKVSAITNSDENSTSNASSIHLDENKPQSNIDLALRTSKAEEVSQMKANAKNEWQSVAVISKAEASVSTDTTDVSVACNYSAEGNKGIELTTEEKIERARQLIELQKKQREEEEKQKQKEQELRRRKVGRDVQKMQQNQQNLKIKQALDEQLQEKAAEAMAREKVKQQIVQDRLEHKRKELVQQEQISQKQQNQEQSKPRTPVSSSGTIARIQFRLPTGNPHLGQFESSSTLGALRTYVIENIKLPFREFAMFTSFPRRSLDTEEDGKTLLELELVPTAVILILPLKNTHNNTTVTTQDITFFSRILWTFLSPIVSIYNYVMEYFSGIPRRSSERQSNSSSEIVMADNETSLPFIRNVIQPASLIRRNMDSQETTTIRAQGNIHRLHSGRDDNDENNTWNGNSTQQM